LKLTKCKHAKGKTGKERCEKRNNGRRGTGRKKMSQIRKKIQTTTKSSRNVETKYGYQLYIYSI
jgi:hypothetical protein